MEIHRFEKLWLGLSLLLILAFIGSIVYGALGAGVAMVDDSGGQVDPTNVTASENFRDPGVYRTGDGEYEVYVEARRFSFVPGSGSPIEVPADTDVTFYITSPDVIHGFNVVGTNLNTMAVPGQVAKLPTAFDESGTYYIVCNEYCGSAHHAMEGSIEVVPQAQFNESAVEVIG
jgi:cytochrome c oxidase subunit 2